MKNTIELEAYPKDREELKRIQNCTHWQGLLIKSIEIDPPVSEITVVRITVYTE